MYHDSKRELLAVFTGTMMMMMMVLLITINVLLLKDHATLNVETRAVTDQGLNTASTVSTSAQAA